MKGRTLVKIILLILIVIFLLWLFPIKSHAEDTAVFGYVQPYAQIWSNVDKTIAIPIANTWYKVDTASTSDFSLGPIYHMSFDGDATITVLDSGTYCLGYGATVTTSGAGNDIGVSVMINGIVSNTMHGHSQIQNSNSMVNVSGTGVLSLNDGDKINLSVKNVSGTVSIVVSHCQVTVTMIGPQ